MMDGFRDYERFLRGEDINPVLSQSKDLGANGRRVFGTMFNIARFDPIDFGEDYYYKIPDFLKLLESYDQYAEWTCFADAGLMKGGPSWQLAHYLRLCDILRPIPNVFLELVNENDSNDNKVDIISFPKPDGICYSSGSNGAGTSPPGPYANYSALHPERRAERIALTTTTVYFAMHGYQDPGGSFAGTQVPTVNNEPQGFGEAPDGRRVTDPEVAYLMGIGCGYGAGGTAHCNSGIESVLLGQNEAECVRQFVRGVKLVCG